MGHLRRCCGTFLLADIVSVLGMLSSWISFDIFQGFKEVKLSLCYRLKHKYHLPLKCKNKLPDCCWMLTVFLHMYSCDPVRHSGLSIFCILQKTKHIQAFFPYSSLEHVLHLPIVCIVLRIHPSLKKKVFNFSLSEHLLTHVFR